MRKANLCVALLSRRGLSVPERSRSLNNAFRIRPSCVRGSPFSTSNFTCSQESKQYPPNSSITPTFVNNRNPRNLEKLRIGEKPDGYRIEKDGKRFWNKVTLDISAKHVSASIIHFQGQKPIEVSTKEWCIKKYLYSTNDASAARLVGQVVAQRCLQAGITEVACFFPEEERKKEKVSLFIKAIEDGGVALQEPSQVLPDWHVHDYNQPETPWAVHEDVDDNVLVASKLREFSIRNKKKPKRREMPGTNDPAFLSDAPPAKQIPSR